MLGFKERYLVILAIVLCELWSDPVFGVRRSRIPRKRKLGQTSLDLDKDEPYGLMRKEELWDRSSHSKKPSVQISAVMGNVYSEDGQPKGMGRGVSYYPGKRGGPYFKPGVGGYAPFKPVVGGGNSYFPGNGGWPYFKPGINGQAPYKPGVGGGPSYFNPGAGGGTSYYNPGGGGQAPYNPGVSGGTSYYNPGAGGSTYYNPGAGGQTSYDPNVGGEATYNPGATSDGKQKPVNMPFRQEVKSDINSVDVKWMGSLNGSQESGKNGALNHVEVVQQVQNSRSLATRGPGEMAKGKALARNFNNKVRQDKDNECLTVRSACGESKRSCCPGLRCKQGRCLKKKPRLERRNYGHRTKMSDRFESRVIPFPSVRRGSGGVPFTKTGKFSQ